MIPLTRHLKVCLGATVILALIFIALLSALTAGTTSTSTNPASASSSARKIRISTRDRLSNALHKPHHTQRSRRLPNHKNYRTVDRHNVNGDIEEDNGNNSPSSRRNHLNHIFVNKSHTKKTKRQETKKNKNRPGPASSVKMAANNNDGSFNAEKVLDLFTSCRHGDDQISIDCYVNAYEELCKLFKAFGTVFGFVTSDVVEKIGILRDYRKSPEANSYGTIQSMLSYEVQEEITNNKKKASGSRTLLRLHRALEFIEELLVKIRDTDDKEKFSTVACKAYDDTLAKHHPWLVKKAVHVAMYVLPSRADLLKKMNLEDTEQGMSALSKLTEELKVIYKITQDLYAKDNLLDLP